MTTEPGSVFKSEEGIVEHQGLWADALRAVASSWRFRVKAGRLGGHSLAGVLHLIARFEAAIHSLEPSPGKPHGPGATAPPQVEDELRQSEERFRLLVDSITDYAIFMLDPDGRISSWNAGAERIKGYRAEEILGKPFSVFYTPEALASEHPAMELKLAARDGRYHEEGWRLRKNGERFWADVTITALRDAAGRLRGYAKVTRDLSERRHIMQGMEEEQMRFQLLVESVRDYAIFMLAPDGTVVSWNEGARRLKGYSAKEIIGQHTSPASIPRRISPRASPPTSSKSPRGMEWPATRGGAFGRTAARSGRTSPSRP